MPRTTKESVKRKSTAKKTRKKEKNIKETKDDIFSFDDEIVIGLKRLDEMEHVPKKTTKRKKNTKSSGKDVENNQKGKNKRKTQKKNKRTNLSKDRVQTVRINTPLSKEEIQRREKLRKKKKLILRIIKWATLLAIIIGGVVYAMMSPIFNIKEVEVLGNSKISSETIISLSGITIDQNMFSFRTSDVRESIKQNAYIDTVDVHRDLPDKISIVVSERKTTYMIKFGNAYAYINNQGYILEITNQEAAVPILTGYETPDENIKEGNRLDTADLERLNDVLKIMEAASSSGNNLKNLITQIDMSDKSNYILNLQTQKKQIYFGDATNLSTKMLWIDQILEEEKKNEGILYLNMDLNTDRPYFREKV